MRRQLIALALPVISGVLLVISARPALAGGGCFQPDTQGAATTVELTAICFSPTILYVQPGDTVTWRNQDRLAHVVAGTFSGWGNPTNLAAGETMTHKFPKAGIYAYSCPLHYGMNAVVVVGDGKATVPMARIQPAAAISTPSQPAPNPWPLFALAVAALGAALGYRVGRGRTAPPPS
jgi:plastocyanin